MRSRWTICRVQKSEMKYDHQMIQKISAAKIWLDYFKKKKKPCLPWVTSVTDARDSVAIKLYKTSFK